jgi:hypothetical protein
MAKPDRTRCSRHFAWFAFEKGGWRWEGNPAGPSQSLNSSSLLSLPAAPNFPATTLATRTSPPHDITLTCIGAACNIGLLCRFTHKAAPHLKEALGARTASMHHTLRDPLAVKLHIVKQSSV